MRRSAAILFSALLLASCTHHKKAAPKPTLDTTTTTAPDLSLVVLRGVNGTTTSTLPTTPGKANITGRVIDASGAAVGGATVRAEWFVNAATVKTDVITGDDGVYTFANVHGGVWRLRAFRPPDRATSENPSFFLAADEQKKLDIKVDTISGVGVTSNIAPNPPVVEQEAELAVLLAEQSVDADGRVTRTPIAGADVTLTGSGHWSLPSGTSTRVTDSNGTARWRLICRSEGDQSLTVNALGQTFPLTIPPCVPETTTTSEAPTTSSTKPSGTTTTTRILTTTTR